MLPQVLPKDQFAEFVSFLTADNRVMAPMAKGPCYAFAEVDGPEDVGKIRMDYTVSILSPKTSTRRLFRVDSLFSRMFSVVVKPGMRENSW